MMTVAILVLAVWGIMYALWPASEPSPEEIPVVKAEGDYKEKPADPGGIDIPHQDVRVYDQLDAKNGGPPGVEHLLPPPETPKEIPQAPTVDAVAPAPEAAPVPAVTAAAPKAEALPNAPTAKTAALPNVAVPKPVATTVAPAAVPVERVAAASSATAAPVALTPEPAKLASETAKPPAAPKEEPMSIEKVLQQVNAKEKAATAPAAAAAAAVSASGEKAAVQLASVPNEAQAREVMAKLQQKYAAELGGAKLHLVRADLGGKGIYYRIQSDSLAKTEANRVCSSLKKLNAGCILVGK
jgi:hypothetical protein